MIQESPRQRHACKEAASETEQLSRLSWSLPCHPLQFWGQIRSSPSFQGKVEEAAQSQHGFPPTLSQERGGPCQHPTCATPSSAITPAWLTAGTVPTQAWSVLRPCCWCLSVHLGNGERKRCLTINIILKSQPEKLVHFPLPRDVYDGGDQRTPSTRTGCVRGWGGFRTVTLFKES